MPKFGTALTIGLLTAILGGPAQAKIPRKLVGKAFLAQEVKDQAVPSLVRQFRGQKPTAKLKRNKDKEWKATLVAFFRKKSIPGPMTLWVYDRADKASIRHKEPVSLKSVPSKPGRTFVYDMLFDPNIGFNKGHSYVIHVGQIIGKRHKIYARGSVSLDP